MYRMLGRFCATGGAGVSAGGAVVVVSLSMSEPQAASATSAAAQTMAVIAPGRQRVAAVLQLPMTLLSLQMLRCLFVARHGMRCCEVFWRHHAL